MKKTSTKLAFVALCIATLTATSQGIVQNKVFNFKENKGQICDQNYNPRPDVLFNGNANGLNFYLTQTGISYQLSRVQSWKEIEDKGRLIKNKIPDLTNVYRIDVKWVNSNKNTKIEKGETVDGIDNYYLQQCPMGAFNVKSYVDLTYKEIYKGIDLKWYEKNNELEYDFLVQPFSDYTQIQFEISGAQQLSINSSGELVVKTPFGNIIEKAPKTYQGTKLIFSKWKLDKNKLSFEVGNYDHSKALTIDPVIRIWGTYYGGSGADYSNYLAKDNANNIYLTGYTASSNNISTVGAHLVTLTGSQIAYLAKFNSNGVRQFGTYYGGTGFEFGTCCAIDASNNIILGGYTQNSTGTAIATPGSHQTANGGVEDGFLVKFNSLGVRQWATFYGGASNDRINSCSVDGAGNIFIVGQTGTTTGTVIVTSGSHQTLIGGISDAFLVKFNGAGVRQWGTYYGGTGNDYGWGSSMDASGNIYMCGETASAGASVIATAASHQTAYAGGADGFLVKFNTSGVRQFGTYYGSNGYENAHCCVVDAPGNIYLSGETNSATNTLIATVGSHQSTHGGGGSIDAYLVSFNSAGVRQWGTYYGGVGYDYAFTTQLDMSGNIYLGGSTGTNGGTVMATANGYQPTWGGGTTDGYVVKFSPSGLRQWGTYYGGGQEESGNACVVDANFNVYFSGQTSTSTGTAIASPSGHQPNYGGGVYDAYLVSLFNCLSPIAPNNTTPVGNQTVCANKSVTLSAIAIGTIGWYANSTGGSSLASGTTFITPTLTAGSYTYFAEAFTCTNSVSRTPITFTAISLPVMSVAANPSVLCDGQPGNSTITVNGALTYSWSTSASGTNIIVSPTITTSYSVIGTNASGCSDSYSISILVSPCTSILSNDAPNEIPLVIYPNPTAGDLYINVEQKCDLVIYNAIGQIQKEVRLSEGNNAVNLQDLNRGIYLLRITQNKLIVNKKVIKQ